MASRIQIKHAYSTSGAMTSNVTAGNLMIVAVSWGTGAVAQDSGISDTRGTSYTRINTIRVSGNFTQLQLYYGYVPSSGSCTITISGGTDMGFTAVEYSGIAQTGLIVTSNTAGGANSAPRIALTGYDGGVIFGAYANETSGTAKPNFTITGMNELSWDGSHLDGQQDVLLSSTGTHTHGYNISPTYANQAYILAALGHFTQPTKTHTTSAYLHCAKSHTTDAIKKVQPTKAHTTDTRLKQFGIKTHLTSSQLLKVTYLLSHTTSSSKYVHPVLAHTTDSLLKFRDADIQAVTLPNLDKPVILQPKKDRGLGSVGYDRAVTK